MEQKWRPLFAVAWRTFSGSSKAGQINAYSEALTGKALEYLASKA
jgi:hypothetical protein